MSKQVQEQRSPVQGKVFSAEALKLHYCEQEMQEKYSNLWVKQSGDTEIRFIRTLPVVFHSFCTETCF